MKTARRTGADLRKVTKTLAVASTNFAKVPNLLWPVAVSFLSELSWALLR